MRMFLFTVAALVALSACAQPLAQSDMAKFAKTADAAAAVVAAPSQIQTRLSSTTADNEARCRYLRGEDTGLATTAARLKPSPLAHEQAKVAKALAAYTKGIIDAVDGKGFDELELAAKGLIGSAGEVATTTGGSNEFGTVGDAIVDIGLRLGEAQRDQRIRAIMRDVYPDLILLEHLVARDAPRIEAENQALVRRWDRATSCVLRSVRKEPSAALALYDAARKDRASLTKQIELGKRAHRAIEALKEAHLIIVTEPARLKPTIEMLKAVYADLEPILDQQQIDEG